MKPQSPGKNSTDTEHQLKFSPRNFKISEKTLFRTTLNGPFFQLVLYLSIRKVVSKMLHNGKSLMLCP